MIEHNTTERENGRGDEKKKTPLWAGFSPLFLHTCENNLRAVCECVLVDHDELWFS